ncbi:immune-regulated catalase isoform 1-T2 [Glossina fuscipes fuscipes]
MFSRSWIIFIFQVQLLRGSTIDYSFRDGVCLSKKTFISEKEWEVINSLTSDDWEGFLTDAIQSYNQEQRLEKNLLKRRVIVENGSISHTQLLDTLPSGGAQRKSSISEKILKASLNAYHSKCAPLNISGDKCAVMLSKKKLPRNNDLTKQCEEMLHNQPMDYLHSFRRLLPRHYKDGFHQMFNHLPNPLLISQKLQELGRGKEEQQFDDSNKSLAIIQWAQFIEHDLSKPVVMSMYDGSSIECCDNRNHKLQPRYRHPACAPLLSEDISLKYGPDTCLTYVRSALTVGDNCTFAAPEKFNQATPTLDLSQLYGSADEEQKLMRSYKDGLLKSTNSLKRGDELLPLVPNERMHKFCSIKEADMNKHLCFMAGDSRVNNNPYTIVIYTIFMRNHNRIARKLKIKYPQWNDEMLFEKAKTINILMYRHIVFEQWLPEVIGNSLASNINKKIIRDNEQQISNEFGVAGIRFFFSMIPNILRNSDHLVEYTILSSRSGEKHVSPPPIITYSSNVFALKKEIYNPTFQYTTKKFNDVLYSLLHQKAMKMDATYENSLLTNFMRDLPPTHWDVLAFDIQRNRDHGLKPYVKYLEECKKTNINNWNDPGKFIALKELNKLKNAYRNFMDIDLIVGGISESAAPNATVGPTFQCIIAEQFSKLRYQDEAWSELFALINELKGISAADLLCANSNLVYVPSNIFRIFSKNNPSVQCSDSLKQ